MSAGLRKLLKITDPITRDGARTCLLVNVCGWPGLGSVLARRSIGYVQMLLALGGLFTVVSALYRFMEMIWEETRYPTWHDHFVWLGIVGVSAFVLSWIWSLITSLAIRKGAVMPPPKRDPTKPPPL
jgi:hypothetical protein